MCSTQNNKQIEKFTIGNLSSFESYLLIGLLLLLLLLIIILIIVAARGRKPLPSPKEPPVNDVIKPVEPLEYVAGYRYGIVPRQKDPYVV